MLLNIHPFIVHLPIGLLSLYALFEIFSIKKTESLPYWFFVKAILVVCGTIGAYAGLGTGSLAAGESESRLIEIHANFAAATTGIFSFLSAIYLLAWFKNKLAHFFEASKYRIFWFKIIQIVNFFLRRWVLIILSFLGFVLITITGALGGAIVYGPDIDPIVKFFYQLLVA
jgi:uncharacterized membrane protein